MALESISMRADASPGCEGTSFGGVLWECPGARWVAASGESLAAPLAIARMQHEVLQAPDWLVRRTPEVPSGFQNFAGLAALLDALNATVKDERSPAWSAHERALALVEAYRRADGAPSPSARAVPDATLFAITRRISRESHESALVIDDLARFVLEIHRECGSLAQGVLWMIDDLYRWDRPSLRCLHRVVDLSQPSDKIAFLGLLDMEPSVESPESVDERIAWARHCFFDRLAETGNFRPISIGRAPNSALKAATPPKVDTSAEDLLLEVELALGYQNYERVYALCGALIRRADGVGDDCSEAHRLLGITHAQLEDFTGAEHEFLMGADTAASATLRAHHYYLLGLLATKRRYRFDEAMRYYELGQRALAGSDLSDPRVRLERGWLLNGDALAGVLRAKGLQSEKRDRLTKRSLDLELEAYRLVKNDRGAHASYLRHNLLANIAFLFEIADRPADAITFWRRAFERYLVADSPVFGIGFHNRLGMLLFKAGRTAEARSALEEASKMARRSNDRFYEERTKFTQGYVALQSGDHNQSLEYFWAGAHLASELRDDRGLRDHVAGMLCSLAETGDEEDIKRLLIEAATLRPLTEDAQRALQAFDGENAAEALAEAGLGLRQPSPKLPSYLPNVDLEGQGRRDLNRYLVTEVPPS